jgi:hypothetical protein
VGHCGVEKIAASIQTYYIQTAIMFLLTSATCSKHVAKVNRNSIKLSFDSFFSFSCITKFQFLPKDSSLLKR